VNAGNAHYTCTAESTLKLILKRMAKRRVIGWNRFDSKVLVRCSEVPNKKKAWSLSIGPAEFYGSWQGYSLPSLCCLVGLRDRSAVAEIERVPALTGWGCSAESWASGNRS